MNVPSADIWSKPCHFLCVRHHLQLSFFGLRRPMQFFRSPTSQSKREAQIFGQEFSSFTPATAAATDYLSGADLTFQLRIDQSIDRHSTEDLLR